MNDNICSCNGSSVDVVQPNMFKNSSNYNSHTSVVIVDNSQNNDSENTKYSGD